MADPDLLTHAFLAAHPDDAARVLEQLPAEDAAALFQRAPARLGAPVLGAMLPYTAARCLQFVEPTRAAMLLAPNSVPAAAAVLRSVPDPRRAQLLDALPTAMALACRALLGYPEDSVGACVDTAIVTLPPDSRVQDALDALRAARAMPAGPVYVVDRRRRPLGLIELPLLLRAGAQDRLETLMRPVSVTLPAITPLAGAADHPVWREVDVAPVVERGGGLVGVVQRRAVQHAQRRQGEEAGAAPESLMAVLALGYWQAVAGLIDTVLSLVTAPPRSRS